MPHPKEVRALGRGWQTLKEEVTAFSKTIPPEGVSRVEFDRACLQRIDFEDRDVITDSLRRAKVIFMARQGVEWRIFGRAVGKRLKDPDADPKLNQFISAVAPSMFRLKRLAAGGTAVEAEVRAKRREATLDVTGFVTRYVGRGGSLPLARSALWDTFTPEAMEIVARCEGGLARDSRLADVAPPPPKPVRIPLNMDPQSRIMEVLHRAGREGMTKSAIDKSFAHPRPEHEQVKAWLDEIEDAQCVYVATCKLGRRGRPGKRYFHTAFEPPTIRDGIAYFD